MMNYKAFIFEDYEWNGTQLLLRYSFDGVVKFTETFDFDFPWVEKMDSEAMGRAVQMLWIMAGVSYFKVHLPSEIYFRDGRKLPEDLADFFSKTYQRGLGELFYQNDIGPPLIEFPMGGDWTKPKSSPLSKQRPLVALGGGKDSLTSCMLLAQKDKIYDTFTVGTYPLLETQVQRLRSHGAQDHVVVKRALSPELFRLNAEGAINGHIPISSILACTSVIIALLRGQKYIIFSNEDSANEPTVPGTDINHQYSKTLEFEQDFRRITQTFVHPELEYFSLLRPYKELHIAQMFVSLAWPYFSDCFTSCNRNFTHAGEAKDLHWCKKCPKCAFVFSIFMPFLGASELSKIFYKNLLTDPELTETFASLLGLTPTKPFECVGEIEEVRQAFYLAELNFPEVKPWLKKFPNPEMDWGKEAVHCKPEGF